MASSSIPATPDSQYVTLISTASKTSFPNNTSSNFTTRFDPPLELRGGDFNVALMDIFHPTKWINITPDKYYVGYELKEKVYHDPKYIDPSTYFPDHRPQQDAPDDSTSSTWSSWWRGTTAEERHKAREEAEERDLRKRRNWTEKMEETRRAKERERKAAAEAAKKEKERKVREREEEERKAKERERKTAAEAAKREKERKAREREEEEDEEEEEEAEEVTSEPVAARQQQSEEMMEFSREQHQRELERRKQAEVQRQKEIAKRRAAEEERQRQLREREAERVAGEPESESRESRRPPPELSNTKWRTIAHTKYKLPSAYYSSIDSVLQNINEHVKEVYKDDEIDVFSMDSNKGKIRLTIKAGVTVRISRKLARLLGFMQREYRGGISKLADHPPDLKKHLGSLHVYVNAMRDRVVGDTMAPLIGMVPHVDVFPPGLKIAHHTFLRPKYFPIKNKFWDTVTVNIRDDKGDLVPFSEGSTTLTLHLVRASP